MKKIFNLIIIILFFTGVLFGVEENAEYFFRIGAVKCAEKDLSGAIEALEKSYKLKKQERVKKRLIEILMGRGKSELLAKRYSNAARCFDKVLVLDPENSEAEKFKFYRISTRKEMKILTAKRKKMRESAKGAVKEKSPEKEVSIPGKPEVLQVKSFVNPIPAREKPLKINLWLGAGIIIMCFITFFLISKEKKEDPRSGIRVLHQPVKKFASKVLIKALQEPSFSPGKIYSPDGTRAMLENPNAHVRARGVELIAEELKGYPTEIIDRILVPCLSDSDNRVKANAAKALYEYNPGVAMNTLRAMTKYSDKWMRLSAAWVLETIGTPEAIENLLLLADDEDKSVRFRTIMFLKRCHMEGKVPENLMQGLKEVLQGEIIC